MKGMEEPRATANHPFWLTIPPLGDTIAFSAARLAREV